VQIDKLLLLLSITRLRRESHAACSSINLAEHTKK
jgi:hypothetical protein